MFDLSMIDLCNKTLYFFDDSVGFVCTACSDKSAVNEACRLNGLGLNYSKCVQVSMHCAMYVFAYVWDNFGLESF